MNCWCVISLRWRRIMAVHKCCTFRLKRKNLLSPTPDACCPLLALRSIPLMTGEPWPRYSALQLLGESGPVARPTFRITDPLWRETTHGFPWQRANNTDLWCSLFVGLKDCWTYNGVGNNLPLIWCQCDLTCLKKGGPVSDDFILTWQRSPL